MKIIFTSFAGGSEEYRLSAKRIREEALNSNFFDKVYVYDDINTSKGLSKFIEKNKEILKERGFGYWSWKPILLLDVFRHSNIGDIICYADSGCQISPYGTKIFNKNIAKCKESGALFFHMPGLLEKNWSKSKLINYLEVLEDKSITDTPMIQATYFYLEVNNKNYDLLLKWAELSVMNNFKLINDEESYGIKDSEFVEHRHDQSILSILAKKNKYYSKNIECHYKNIQYYINSKILLYPVHSLRNRTRNMAYKIPFKYSSIRLIETNLLIIKILNKIIYYISFIFKVYFYIKKKILKEK